MKSKFLSFGEIMLRLKAPGFDRLFQSPTLEATFGGGEANVALSLANFGIDAAYTTILPDNEIGTACLRELRKYGVDVSKIVRKPGRMGIYYLESGACQRPSNVVYDRAHSSFCDIKPGDIDWDKVLDGVEWFHISGITPAVSESAAEESVAALKAAKARGVTTSCDINYRGKLWKYGKKAEEVMPDLLRLTDVAIAGAGDFQKALGTDIGRPEPWLIEPEYYHDLGDKVMKDFPNVKLVAITLRETKSAEHCLWSACLNDGKEFIRSRIYEITDIVDRVGGGDSFSAGLIYGLMTDKSLRDALEFAVGASTLKHTINGDFNLVTVKEVETLTGGDGTGRITR